MGQSPAQVGKSAFKRRGKPINGWSRADRNIGREYQQWCQRWAKMVLPKMKNGASLFVFGARRTIHRVVNAFEDSGFLLKDILAWKKESAHHRAQRVSIVFEPARITIEAEAWMAGVWANLAPIYEPIAWFTKPYKIGGTLADNILEHGVGAMNLKACQGSSRESDQSLGLWFPKGRTQNSRSAKAVETHRISHRTYNKRKPSGARPVRGKRHHGRLPHNGSAGILSVLRSHPNFIAARFSG